MTTAFWSNTESVCTVRVGIPSLCCHCQSNQITQVNHLGSPPGLLSAVPYCYRKNYYIIHLRMHLGAVTCVLLLQEDCSRIFYNKELWLLLKQFLLAHIPLFCEDCPLDLTAAVQENTSEETPLSLFIKWSLLLAPRSAKLCSIPSRYDDICTEHAQWSFTRALYSENSTALPLKVEECSPALPGRLGWVTVTSSLQLVQVFLLPLSLLPVAPSGQQKIFLVLCQ